MTRSTVIFAIFFLAAPFAVSAASLICLMVFVVQLSVFLLRVSAKLAPAQEWTDQTNQFTPIFSIHLAIHNEPTELVINTINALSLQEYPEAQWEVIVIDNNTADAALWHPVMNFCLLKGPQFKFLHRDGVKGAKAGALNIALEHTRPDATHVVTIDADYIATPDFLAKAERALIRTGADYVQFPQAYRRPCGTAEGTDVELQEYFLSDARIADEAEAVLLTGTLCIISTAALREVGGWSGCTATEDAELGIRLCRAGFRGRYISSIVGKGLLPLSFRDLEKQRYRWSSGNLRTLILHGSNLLLYRGLLRGRQVVAITAQLSAWLNFTLVPTACLLAAAITQTAAPTLITIAALSLLLSLAETLTRLLSRKFCEGYDAPLILSAMTSRIALAPVSARATVAAFIPGPQKFVVTRKAARAQRKPLSLPLDHLALFIMALISLWELRHAPLLHLLGTAVLLLPLPAVLWVMNELSRYRHSIQPNSSIEVNV